MLTIATLLKLNMHTPNHAKIFAFLLYIIVTAAFPALEARDYQKTGYECGDKFFSSQIIEDSLLRTKEILKKYPNLFLSYTGNLYENYQGYMLWPLKEDESELKLGKITESPYQVVFNTEFQVIDVIALMKNYQHIKCSKVDRSQPAHLAPATEEGDGYQCGHQFFPDPQLEVMAASKNSRPLLYSGSLYNPNVRPMLLPIGSISDSRRKEKYNPYRLVKDGMTNIIGVVAETVDSNLVKCQRSWAKSAGVPGYQCHSIFFEKDFVKETVKAARLMSSKYNIFPNPQAVNSFSSEARPIWPLKSEVSVARNVDHWPYWVSMTKSLEPTFIFMLYNEGGRQVVCKESTMLASKYYNNKALDCGGKIFWEQQLNRAAMFGCKSNSFKLKMSQDPNNIPTEFSEPMGPDNTVIKGMANYYVIYNTKCQVVRAIYRQPDSRLARCEKM